tara:strand:- start:1935 stop:2444 length:510 start_codon:yes stop_codon:yes gene_type:complete
MEIKYQVGDMFELMDKTGDISRPRILPHVCNNQSAWGAGFVIPLGRNFPVAKQVYLDTAPVLGNTQLVKIRNGDAPGIGPFYIANMVAQTLGKPGRNLLYGELCKCLAEVGRLSELVFQHWGRRVEIHAPKFGSDLAGGNWDFITELIGESWSSLSILSINIYSLPPKE